MVFRAMHMLHRCANFCLIISQYLSLGILQATDALQRMLISRSCFSWMSKCSHGHGGRCDDLAHMES